MQKISTELLTKEVNDIIIHRACVMRSGMYLANYLSAHNRSLDALGLLHSCAIHDISKISNTPEFMSLASIVEQQGEMNDVGHKLNSNQKEAIRLHWENNSHHAENYQSPNDMPDQALMEMAVDCHARSKQYKTNLLEYIDLQQELRFHFDNEHYIRLRKYCEILVLLTKNDDYSDILRPKVVSTFSLKDSTLEAMEHFDESIYPLSLETERLYLQKKNAAGLGMVCYDLRAKNGNVQVGEIYLKCNGYFEYKIYNAYVGNYYASEAIRKIVDVSKLHVFRLIANKEDGLRNQTALETGFIKAEVNENSYVYKLNKTKRK